MDGMGGMGLRMRPLKSKMREVRRLVGGVPGLQDALSGLGGTACRERTRVAWKSIMEDGWVDLCRHHAQCERLYLPQQIAVHLKAPHLRPRHTHPPHSPGSLPRTSFQSQSALPLVMGHSKSTSRSSTPGSYSQSIFSERIVPPSCSHLSCASQKWHLEERKKGWGSNAKVLSRPCC